MNKRQQHSVLLTFMAFILLEACLANTPPKFVLDDPGGGDIVLRLKEGQDTPPGSVIYRAKAFDADGDPLTFGVLSEENTLGLVQVENQVNSNEASLVLRQSLDAENQKEHQLILTVTDGRLGAGNFITQSLLIVVEDVNDNVPIFEPHPPSIQVREHSATPLSLLSLTANDKDSGIYGQVIYSLESDEPGDLDIFTVSTVNNAAELKLVGDLDFEKQRLHQLRVVAKDRANFGRVNSATSAILIRVQDVEDEPPEFVSVPSLTRLAEDVPTFTEVLQVRAIDGDRGINNKISYDIIHGPDDIFAITAESGIVYTLAEIDRESDRSANGAYILGIRAYEEGGGAENPGSNERPYVDTEVTIMIEDVNDETPTFRSSSYVGEIGENSPRATPILFLGGNVLPEVYDHDVGTNGTFQLFLEGDQGIFEVTPNQGINEASFMIRVKQPSLLDYEVVNTLNFTIVAREITKDKPKESRANVQVHIRDVNDNSPEFTSQSFEVYVAENIGPGATIAWIRSQDRDSGILGTSGIRYTGLTGPMSEFLVLDKKSGIVTVGNYSNVFDRETTSSHFLTVEARDDIGRGNRNTVELRIKLTDVNDNPPIFEQKEYNAFLKENSLEFEQPIIVTAVDGDENGTENAVVRYRIVRGNVNENFTIDSVTGKITPSGTIDYEKLMPDDDGNRVFNLTVRAFDLGTPPLFTDAIVKVYVLDKNDNDPVFNEAYYRVSLPEDANSGFEVVTVTAKDDDGSAPYNEIVYRITSGAKDKFVIEPDSGKLLVSRGASLDPDLTLPRSTSYFLEITAFDGGVGENRRSGKTHVNITIDDVNNKPPVFDEDTFLPVTIFENVEPGYFVRRIQAYDPDLTSQLKYYIDFNNSEARDENSILVPGFNVTDYFAIDQDSGEILVVGDLDRELVQDYKVVIVVEDVKADIVASQFRPQVHQASLFITILDVNDNDPEFKETKYKVMLQENVAKNANIATVAAEDPDKNRTVTYSLIEDDLDIISMVDVDPVTGAIYVLDDLDYEEIHGFNITVQAVDDGVPARSSRVNVEIEIIDENDNDPFFLQPTTNITVREDTPPDTVIARLEALDLDSGEFGEVTYFLDKSANLGHFKIDPVTGELSTRSDALDREIQDRYTLIVHAYDNYQFGFSTGESRHSFAQVFLSVTDVNDQVPVFEDDDFGPQNCAIVNEFHDMNEPILVARATDGDDSRTPNGVVEFSIESGNDLKLFRLEKGGKLMPNRPLKGFYGNYSLSISASDQGYPPNSVVKKFPICIQDFNDNAPKFISPPKNFTIRVPENASLGSELVAVQAIDTDIGSNGAVRYRMRPDPLGNHRSFDIDPVSGMVTLTQSLDRERQKLYEIRIEAFDLGVPTSLTSDMDLRIYVKNVNDHEPQFLVKEFRVNFTENTSPGVERIKIIGTIDKDDDSDDYESQEEIPEVCYFIISSDGPQRLFAIHPTKHELMVNEELDRELRSTYHVIIKATEDCNTPQDHESYNETILENNSSMLKIIINVNDVDDNPPEFIQRVFTGGIATDNDYGSAIMNVQAQDPDENSSLEYSVIGNILPADGSENLENIKNPPFLLNRNTGDLLLNFDPQKGMKGYFAFHVSVSDAFGHTDKATVHIYLLREDQRVRFVFRSHPSDIRARIGRFRQVLGKVTSSIVNVDHYVMHQDDKTKTDVLLHFVNSGDNTIMEVDQVLRMIDYKVEELDPIFKEFNVLYTEGVKPTFHEGMSDDTIIILWLIGFNVFQAILILLILAICYNQRAKYKRRLKAATIGNSIISDTLLKRNKLISPIAKAKDTSTVVPNTNKHATEGSNPIWMSNVAYDNMTFTPDEDLEDDDELDGNFLERLEQPDSLDANVLNSHTIGKFSDDLGYAGSTLRVGSSMNKTLMNMPLSHNSSKNSSPQRPRLRSHSQSRQSSVSSSGLGSGNSRKFIGLYPSQMPPVERLNMEIMSPGPKSSASKKKFYGFTTYDEDNIPRTEL